MFPVDLAKNPPSGIVGVGLYIRAHRWCLRQVSRPDRRCRHREVRRLIPGREVNAREAVLVARSLLLIAALALLCACSDTSPQPSARSVARSIAFREDLPCSQFAAMAADQQVKSAAATIRTQIPPSVLARVAGILSGTAASACAKHPPLTVDAAVNASGGWLAPTDGDPSCSQFLAMSPAQRRARLNAAAPQDLSVVFTEIFMGGIDATEVQACNEHPGLTVNPAVRMNGGY